MKKVALVLVFVFLIALFVSLNFLIWDREGKLNELKNLETENVNNLADISAKSREIKSLEDENSKLRKQVIELNSNIQLSDAEAKQLKNDKNKLNQTLARKIEMIKFMKENLNVSLFNKSVINWANAISSGRYSEAYQIEYMRLPENERSISIDEYTNNIKNSIKSLKLKSVKMENDKGNVTGVIILSATLEVRLSENSNLTVLPLKEGINVVYFELDYNTSLKDFVIMSMYQIP